MRRGTEHGCRGPFGAPSASLGISPADSNARRTAQLPLALTPLRFAQGRSDSVRMTGLKSVAGNLLLFGAFNANISCLFTVFYGYPGMAPTPGNVANMAGLERGYPR